MKIAIWHNLPSGGAKRALFDQVVGLLEKGHELESWCPPTADRQYLPLSDLIPEHVLPLGDESTGSRLLRRLKLNPYEPGARYRAMEAHCRACAAEINAGGFDLFFGNACVEYRVSPIARFVDIPSTIYLGEPHRWFYEALPELPWLAPEIDGSLFNPRAFGQTAVDLMRNRHIRILARQELTGARAYDRILTNSRYSRESILKAYGIDAGVCYLGINADLFRTVAVEKTRTVVGVGSFDRIKNIEFVIRAVALLGDLNPRLVWIGNSGEASYQAELVALADRLGVDYEPRLMIPDEEMVRILNAASVMAYAPRLEPFGLTPLEANCCGLPVVGVAEGGVRESVSHGNNGLLVEADPAAMAEALRRFLEDSAYAAEFGQRAREWVLEHWSMQAATDRLEVFFRQIAGSTAS